jgi:hypothetical protein
VGVFLWSDKHRAGNLSILLFNPIGLLSQDWIGVYYTFPRTNQRHMKLWMIITNFTVFIIFIVINLCGTIITNFRVFIIFVINLLGLYIYIYMCVCVCVRERDVNLPLYLTKHHAIKTYRRNGGTAPRILNLGTRWRWAVSFVPPPLYARHPFIIYL